MLTFVEHSAIPAIRVRQNLDLKSGPRKLKMDASARRNIKNPRKSIVAESRSVRRVQRVFVIGLGDGTQFESCRIVPRVRVEVRQSVKCRQAG